MAAHPAPASVKEFDVEAGIAALELQPPLLKPERQASYTFRASETSSRGRGKQYYRRARQEASSLFATITEACAACPAMPSNMLPEVTS